MNPIFRDYFYTPWPQPPSRKGPGDSTARRLSPGEKAIRKAKTRTARASRRRNRG